MLGNMKRSLFRWVTSKIIFNRSVQERICRQAFFYNAFKALSFNGISGDYAEFGSHGGVTIALAYHESRRHEYKARLWAFDSFSGLPARKNEKDDHPMWDEGTLSTSLNMFHELCAANRIPRSDYEVVAGFYDQTLSQMHPNDSPHDIALAYIDCDLYSSTISVLEFLKPRFKHGMIIAFDDYHCWSPTQISGERKAMLDFFNKDKDMVWELVPYIQFGWHGNSFVVEDRRLYA